MIKKKRVRTLPYKVKCSHCHNLMVDATRYMKRFYEDGAERKVIYECPVCHTQVGGN